MKPLGILKTYFGFKDGQGLKDFADEVKQLSPQEKRELAELAAKEMGVAVDAE